MIEKQIILLINETTNRFYKDSYPYANIKHGLQHWETEDLSHRSILRDLFKNTVGTFS